MFDPVTSFSGFSVDDTTAAEKFYGEVLGLAVAMNDMGILNITLPGGGTAIAYPKPNHVPATFTILNFAVADVEGAVDELTSRGVNFRIYNDDPEAAAQMHLTEKGISPGKAAGYGPDIAWFTDPAGNVLAVLSAD